MQPDLTPEEIRIKFEQIQGQFAAMTLKDQDDDDKLDQLPVLKKRVEDAILKYDASFQQINDSIFSLQNQVKSLLDNVDVMKGTVASISSTFASKQDLTREKTSLRDSIFTVIASVEQVKQILSPTIDSAIKTYKDIADCNFSQLKADIEAVNKSLQFLAPKDLVDAIETRVQDVIVTAKKDFFSCSESVKAAFNDHLLNYAEDRKALEGFKSGLADTLTTAFRSHSNVVDQKIATTQSSLDKFNPAALKDQMESLQLDHDIKNQKTEIHEREIDIIKRKLEKFGLYIRNLELSKQE